jgi:hypothetical protein
MEGSKFCEVELLQRLRISQFSSVYRVRIKSSGKHYALKKILIDEGHESR